MVPSWLKMAPDAPKTAQESFKMAPRRPQTDQVGSKTASRRPKMAPRRPKMAPRWPQVGPKTAPREPKMAPRRPRWPQDRLKTAQDDPADPSKVVLEVCPAARSPFCQPFLFLSNGEVYGLGEQVFRVALARRAPALRAQYGGRACEVHAVLTHKPSSACKPSKPKLPFGSPEHSGGPAVAACLGGPRRPIKSLKFLAKNRVFAT